MSECARYLRAGVAGVFSLMVVVLGMLGVYGVMSYTVAQRTQEIDIRMALGARPGQVAGIVVGRAMTLTFIGLALGLAGATAASGF
jgi:ABC-type antimicrobial peptide transport system permease subunit